MIMKWFDRLLMINEYVGMVWCEGLLGELGNTSLIYLSISDNKNEEVKEHL